MSTTIGLLLALGSAVFKSTKSITTKIAAVGTDEYITGFATRIIGAFIFLSLILTLQSFYVPDDRIFWIALSINSVLLGLTTILFTKGLKISDVSIISPIMALIPVIVTIPAFFVLGEVPTVTSGFGLILVAVGAYVLNIGERSDGYLQPFRKIAVDRGVQYTIIGLITAAFIPSFDKIGINASDPFTWVFYQHLGSAIFILFAVFMFTDDRSLDRGEIKILFVVGLANSVIWVFQSHAYDLTQVSYVQAIKRVSILISVVIGHYYFEEENLRERISGAFLMLVGIILIGVGAG